MWEWLKNLGRSAEEDAVGVVDEIKAVIAKLESLEQTYLPRLVAIEQALVRLQGNPLIAAAEQAAEQASPAIAAAIETAKGLLTAVAMQASQMQAALPPAPPATPAPVVPSSPPAQGS